MYNKKGEYIGKYFDEPLSEDEKKARAKHPIYLYSPKQKYNDKKLSLKLNKIVNVYKHNIYDFEINTKKIIDHFAKYYGIASLDLFTLTQGISFRVYEGQEPCSLSLFDFMINYSMMILPICMGVDMHGWTPLDMPRWTNSAWRERMNEYIKKARPLGNMRMICEYIEMSKYLINLWCAKAGDRIALSISNNDFLSVMEQSKEAYESITCSFYIPKNIKPHELEELTDKRTKRLLDIISSRVDLPISVYAKLGLFNPTQFREFAVHITYKPDLYGNTIPYTYPTNIMMGLNDPRAFMVDAAGGRKAEVVKLNVSDAGALERSLSMLMSELRYVDVDYECDSKHFRKRRIEAVSALQKLDGRVATLNPDEDEYFIISKNAVDLVGKLVYLKTPITCTHPRRKEGYICSACYGKLMSTLNNDVHIGRLAAFNSADDMEQLLLSAKHALKTHTREVTFNEETKEYFAINDYEISLSPEIIDESLNDNSIVDHLYLEFPLVTMEKHLDGELKHFDRSIPEIIIYNDLTDTHTVIEETNKSLIYLTPEFVSNYILSELKFRSKDDVVLIPFNEIVDTGKVITEVLFEFQYKNQEIAGALLELKSILSKGDSINSFGDYDECLETLFPLFTRGGISLPELQTEMLISEMIFTPDGERVDWKDPNPNYVFYSIDKSIENRNSALTSVTYQDTASQLAGAKGTYNKTGTEAYDNFIINTH